MGAQHNGASQLPMTQEGLAMTMLVRSRVANMIAARTYNDREDAIDDTNDKVIVIMKITRRGAA